MRASREADRQACDFRITVGADFCSAMEILARLL